MAKCHNNRKKRQKRDRKFLERVTLKRIAPTVYRLKGVSPRYYDIILKGMDVEVRGGKRCVRKVRYNVRPNQRYYDTVALLLEKTRGLTVDLSPFLEDDKATEGGDEC